MWSPKVKEEIAPLYIRFIEGGEANAPIGTDWS